MRMSLGGALSGALADWRRNRAVLWPVAGVFFALPAMAMALLVALPMPDPADTTPVIERWSAFVQANAPWLIGQWMLDLFGAAVVLVLLLDPARPTVREAMRTAVRRMPALIVAALACAAATIAGLLLLVVPGLYVLGRTFLVPAVIVAEPQRGIGGGLVHAIERTERHGIQLFLLIALVWLAGNLVVSFVAVLDAGMTGAISANPVAAAIVAALQAAASAGVSLAYALLRVQAYRRLAARRG